MCLVVVLARGCVHVFVSGSSPLCTQQHTCPPDPARSDAQLAELRLVKRPTDVLEAAIKACRSFPESEQVSTNFLWLVAKGKRDKYMKASAETAGVDVASPELQKMLDEV